MICVLLPHATFGLVMSEPGPPFDQPVVIDAPPIARCAMGWSERRVIEYFSQRGQVRTM